MQNHSFQFCIIYKLDEGARCLIFQVINEEVTGLELVLTFKVHH